MYFLNAILLERLSPQFNEETNRAELFVIKSALYMKKNSFFMTECGPNLNLYYNLIKKVVSKEILVKNLLWED